MVFEIGSTDFSNYIAFQGLKWTRNDIDGQNAGRALDGHMIRDYLTTKDKLEITCRPLTSTELSTLLNALELTTYTPTLQVRYSSPRGGTVTKEMYLSNVPASYCINKGTYDLWSGVELHLIEV